MLIMLQTVVQQRRLVLFISKPGLVDTGRSRDTYICPLAMALLMSQEAPVASKGQLSRVSALLIGSSVWKLVATLRLLSTSHRIVG